jgi:hypothetical protein
MALFILINTVSSGFPLNGELKIIFNIISMVSVYNHFSV